MLVLEEISLYRDIIPSLARALRFYGSILAGIFFRLTRKSLHKLYRKSESLAVRESDIQQEVC